MTAWTPERRARQAKIIRQTRPWEKATGPTTSEGKKKVSKNAYKGGVRFQLAKLSKLLDDI